MKASPNTPFTAGWPGSLTFAHYAHFPLFGGLFPLQVSEEQQKAQAKQAQKSDQAKIVDLEWQLGSNLTQAQPPCS